MSRDAVNKMDILLVEDNLEDARIAIQALKCGKVQCRVSLVCDGEEAISYLYHKREFARAPTPDLILVDIRLPKNEGQRVLAELQAVGAPKDIPVVVIDGLADSREAVQVRELHLDGFMTKPVELKKVVALVRSRRRSWLTELVWSSRA